MARRYYSTTAQRTTLASSCTDSATTIVVTAATGFPSSTPFPLVLDADTVNEEAVLVTSRVGTTCTVTRAYDGTTGVAHSAGATVRHAALALDFNEASEHVNETTTAHGLTLADVITTSNTKTLTNKTLTTPTIGSMVNANHDHSAGAGGGVLPASSVLNRPINDQSGTTYTFALADARKHVIGSNSGTKTFTIPLQAAVTWLADASIVVTNTGSGVMTLAITATGTLNGSDLTLSQGESATLLRTASNVWWCLPFSTGSGAVARGTLSGTTGSPATSANGGATAYKWTSSGDFTVATAGLFSGLVVGGGGGGGKYGSTYAQGGGGGGGQVLSLTDFYLAAGTYTVTVGAGGAAGAASIAGVGGRSVLGPFTAAGGGMGSGTLTFVGGDGANGGGCDGQAASTPGRSVTGGYAGGDSSSLDAAGGGGGAGANGSTVASTTGGAGGAGVSSSITGSAVTYGGGGGGGGDFAGGAGGSGGGGGGAYTGAAATAGTANTGGGGGGSDTGNAGAGGTGVVVLLVGTV